MMSIPFGLTEEQLDEYKEMFSLFDEDGDGSITLKELGRVMRSLGAKPSQAVLKNIIKEVDVDENGTIDFMEFLECMSKITTQDTDELMATFKIFDIDGDGFISMSELREVMEKMGDSVSESELTEMITSVDTNGDGKIDYEEFAQLLVSLSKE